MPTTERRAVSAAPAWGANAQGLQCRLRPARRLWRADETPTFKVDLRNQGKRLFPLACEPLEPHRISIDKQGRRWPSSGPAATRMMPFGPGAEFTDLMLTLPEETARRLTRGRHIIEIAFVFEGIEVVSNAVEIEIQR